MKTPLRRWLAGGATRIGARRGVLAVAAASALVGGVAQPAFGLFAFFAAALPEGATSVSRERAELVAYGLAAWALFGFAPFLTVGEHLGGPYGNHTAVFALALLVATCRIAWLRGAELNSQRTPTSASGAQPEALGGGGRTGIRGSETSRT